MGQQSVHSARGTSQSERLSFAENQLFKLARLCGWNNMPACYSLADQAAPLRGIAQNDFNGALFALRIPMRDRRVGIGIRTPAIDHLQRVPRRLGFDQSNISGEVERLTIHRDDEIAAPDRRRLEP